MLQAVGRRAVPVRTGVVGAAALLGGACAALVAGLALARISAPAGELAPLAVLLIPTIPLVALAIVADPRWAAAAIFLTLPFTSRVDSIGPFPLQPVELVTAAVVPLVVLHRLASGRGLLGWSAPMGWALGWLGWSLLALPSALDQSLAVRQIGSLAGALVIVSLIIAVCPAPGDVRRVVGMLVAAGAIVGAIALAGGGDLQASYGGAVVSGRFVGSFTQPNQLGSFAALLWPLAALCVFEARGRTSRYLSIVALALLSASLLLSLSRGAWIGAALALVYVLVALPRARTALLWSVMPLVVAAMLVGAFAPSNPQIEVVGQRVGSFTAGNPYDDRPTIWAEALREIRADPWTGQGPGSFPVASARSTSRARSVSADHAHNIWLSWAAEDGIPGAALLTAFMISIGIAAHRLGRRLGRSRDRSALRVALNAALITVVGQGLVDYTWRNQAVFFAIAAVVGCSLAYRRSFTT